MEKGSATGVQESGTSFFDVLYIMRNYKYICTFSPNSFPMPSSRSKRQSCPWIFRICRKVFLILRSCSLEKESCQLWNPAPVYIEYNFHMNLYFTIISIRVSTSVNSNSLPMAPCSTSRIICIQLILSAAQDMPSQSKDMPPSTKSV